MRKFIFVISFFVLHALGLFAQEVFREVYISWDDFVAEYYSFLPMVADDEAEGVEENNDYLEELAMLAASPLNINQATRSDLLQLPFLSESQADSILSYRDFKRRIITLGELQFVKGMDYNTRRYLSLFVFAGEPIKKSLSFAELLTKGKHELSFTAEHPFYKRAGFSITDNNGELKRPSQIYLGSPLKHSVRYRYKYGKRVSYGFTLEQDAGEPFPVKGGLPYDYNSFYVNYASADDCWKVYLGDYKVNFGLGLLMGRPIYAGQLSLLNGNDFTSNRIISHKGTDETNFLRGAAVKYSGDGWETSAFLSYRRLDANLTDGVVTSLLTSGLHRTSVEQQRRHNLGTFTAGANFSRIYGHHVVSLNGYWATYEYPIQPSLSDYNRHYLRGKEAAGFSASHGFKHKRWTTQIELAMDRGGHPAAIGWGRLALSSDFLLVAQGRWLSNQYVAPYSNPLVASSKSQGEQGFMCGITHRAWLGLGWKAYVDVYRFTNPTYRAECGARGLKTYLQIDKNLSDSWQIA